MYPMELRLMEAGSDTNCVWLNCIKLAATWVTAEPQLVTRRHGAGTSEYQAPTLRLQRPIKLRQRSPSSVVVALADEGFALGGTRFTPVECRVHVLGHDVELRHNGALRRHQFIVLLEINDNRSMYHSVELARIDEHSRRVQVVGVVDQLQVVRQVGVRSCARGTIRCMRTRTKHRFGCVMKASPRDDGDGGFITMLGFMQLSSAVSSEPPEQ